MYKALKLILDNPDLLVSYEQGVAFLERSRVIAFLREKAHVNIIDGGSDVQKSAAEAHRSLGYSQALDDLMYFKERHAVPPNNEALPQALYGALERANEKNDLLQEEIDALRTNTKPKYPTHTTSGTNLNK